MILSITQGSTETPAFKLKIRGQPITDADVKKVEFAFEFETVIKTFPNDNVTFDGEKGAFCVPLTQEDTFLLTAGESNYQVRVFFNDNSVKPTPLLPLLVKPSISKVVLK